MPPNNVHLWRHILFVYSLIVLCILCFLLNIEELLMVYLFHSNMLMPYALIYVLLIYLYKYYIFYLIIYNHEFISDGVIKVFLSQSQNNKLYINYFFFAITLYICQCFIFPNPVLPSFSISLKSSFKLFTIML